MRKSDFNTIFRDYAGVYMREAVLVEGKFNGLVPVRTKFVEELVKLGLPSTGCIQKMQTISRSGQSIFRITAVYDCPKKGRGLRRLEINPESQEVFEDVFTAIPEKQEGVNRSKLRVGPPIINSGARQRAHPGLEFYDKVRDPNGQQQAYYGKWKNDDH